VNRRNVCAAAVWLFASVLPVRLEAQAARQLIEKSGIKGGLVLHVGCGSGAKTMEMRVSESYLVHGLDTDPEKVAEARKRIRDAGTEAGVSVSCFGGKALPFIDNVAALIVAEKPGAVAEREFLRVLAPNGIICILRNGGWEMRSKPRPQTIDQWTHFLHGPGGNAVSNDTVVEPPRHMQWLGAPYWTRNHHKLASISSVVSAQGRIFHTVDTGPAANMSVPGKWWLVGRDAFSGVLLWQRPMASWAWIGQGFRSGPVQLPRTLVAVDNRVYAPLEMNAAVSALDAATGQTITTYAETQGAEEVILSNGVLIVVVGAPFSEQAAVDPSRRGGAPYPNTKEILALRAQTGDILWKWSEPEGIRYMPLTLVAGTGRVAFQAGTGIVCLDRETGQELWSTAAPEKPAPKPPQEKGKGKKRKRRNYGKRGPGWSLATLVLHENTVLWASAGRLRVLDATNGKALWACPCRAGFRSPSDIFVINGLVWLGAAFTEGRDLRTGEVKQTSTAVRDTWTAGHHHRCHREKATSRYILTSHRGIEFLDLDGNNHSRNNWIRGLCQYGIMPCNGLVYAPSHACGCYMEAKLYGFWAVAGARAPRPPAAEIKRLVPGPAWGRTEDGRWKTEAKDHSWSTYRHDALRSGSTMMELAPVLKSAWQTELGGKLSPLVVASGLVLVAEIDARRVTALNAMTGAVCWQFVAGGRIDSPPTLYRGLALFGAADGWVYCLRASDGEEVWRFRAAPEDLRTVAMDQVESLWPVHGSILVQDGVAYAAAGRSSHLDGGIRLYALEPATGKVLHETTIQSTHPVARDAVEAEAKTKITRQQLTQNATDYKTFTDPDLSDAFSMTGGTIGDILVSDGTSIYLRHLRFNRACVQQKTKGRHLFSTSRLLDAAEVHRSHWVVGTADFSRTPVAYSWIANAGGTRWGKRLAVPYGIVLAFAADTVWGVNRRGGYTVFAQPHKPFSPDEKVLPDFRTPDEAPTPDMRWSGKVDLRPRAILRAGDVLVIGGMSRKPIPNDPHATFEGRGGGLLWTLSTKEATRLAEHKLDSPPVWDGMAAAGGKLYVATTAGTVICMTEDAATAPKPIKLRPGKRAAKRK